MNKTFDANWSIYRFFILLHYFEELIQVFQVRANGYLTFSTLEATVFCYRIQRFNVMNMKTVADIILKLVGPSIVGTKISHIAKSLITLCVSLV